MKPNDDPFVPLASASLSEDAGLAGDDSTHRQSQELPVAAAPSVGRLQGFDLLEQPQLVGLSCAPGRVLTARTTVPLKRAMRGREVLVVFEHGDVDRPIIIGVIEPHPLQVDGGQPKPDVQVTADGERHVIEAEREIVLKCGDASITLTRAGKVLIRGNYIVSRSTGYNKIKGAAIDIN